MYCLKNIDAAKIPNDIVRRYLELYRFIGRNHEMAEITERDFSTLVRRTVEADAYHLGALVGASVPEKRAKRLLAKNLAAKTKDERLLKHLLEAFVKMHAETETFELMSRELADLLTFVYKGVEHPAKLRFAESDKKPSAPVTLLSTGQKTKREALENLVKSYKEIKGRDLYEEGFLATNFYVDFINLRPFRTGNELIGLLSLYVLFLRGGYACFHLSGFFEKLLKRRESFQKHVKEASHNWNEGLSDTIGLHRFFLDIALEAYKDVHELLRNYTFDQQMNKSDYIENTVNRLEEVFTKADIREAHPTVSDSTIDRTLRRLRDEKKIRPLGKGRSAKWMKLYPNKNKSIHEQLNLKL